VVVALHLEDGRIPVAQVDDASVLARPLDDDLAGRRQFLEMDAARLVGAMLRPHDREDAEFGDRRFTAENAEQALVFVALEAVLGHELGRDFLIVRAIGGHAGLA
jgi:hypothetical protein